MGFKLAIIAPRKTSDAGLKVSLTKAKNNPARMNFSIPAAMVSAFGWAGGDKLEVLIGTDMDYGLIRIRAINPTRPNEANATLIERFANHAKTKYYAINLGPQPDFVDRAERSTKCEYRIVTGGEIEITLPAYSKVKRADEPKQPATQRTAPNVPLTEPIMERREPGRPPGKPVTGSLMGDPKQPATRTGVMEQLGKYKG